MKHLQFSHNVQKRFDMCLTDKIKTKNKNKVVKKFTKFLLISALTFSLTTQGCATTSFAIADVTDGEKLKCSIVVDTLSIGTGVLLGLGAEKDSPWPEKLKVGLAAGFFLDVLFWLAGSPSFCTDATVTPIQTHCPPGDPYLCNPINRLPR